MWAHCASTGQEVTSVVLQQSHIYTYMLTVCGVYVVCYPTLLEWTSCPQVNQAIERERERERERETVGLSEERGVGLRDWCLVIILPGQDSVHWLAV